MKFSCQWRIFKEREVGCWLAGWLAWQVVVIVCERNDGETRPAMKKVVVLVRCWLVAGGEGAKNDKYK